jgi:hypothetical protein
MDIDKFSRFSMCNCLTVRMDRLVKEASKNSVRTYTAHLMTPHLFLRKVEPGVTIDVPFKDYWPKSKYIRQYVIPKRVRTFLLSTFNEIYHPNHSFGDGIRYVVPRGFRNKLPKSASIKSIKRITAEQFSLQLKKIDKKISDMWGDVCKILVFYDHSRASTRIQERAELFNQTARLAVNWPVIQVRERFPSEVRTWQHYSNKIYLELYKLIGRIERRT